MEPILSKLKKKAAMSIKQAALILSRT